MSRRIRSFIAYQLHPVHELDQSPPNSLRQVRTGDLLGRYELVAPIAEGGMAAVWAARLRGNRGFSKTFAIKTMLPALSDDPRFETMFLDEASLASRIRHPNVVEILDLGEQDNVLYLVMEWVDGEPLGNLRRDAVRAGGMPLPVAVRIAADACAGLHAAHELRNPETGAAVGLVHRDISPQNILVTFSGIVKIVDFGVAKAAGRSAEKTSAGQVKGKPPYMSPEQALGEEVDRRTDIFALGIILYQLTTGKHPFRGQSDLVTLHNIVSDKPIVAPRAYDKNIPKSLNSAIMKALSRDRSERFQTMAEFEAALDAVSADVPRARQQEVAEFVQRMAGKRGEQRRKRILAASRQAEERSRQMDGAQSGTIPTAGQTPVSGHHQVAHSPRAHDTVPAPDASAGQAFTPQTTTSASSGGDQNATTSDSSIPPPKRRPVAAMAALTVGAALALGGAIWWFASPADKGVSPEEVSSGTPAEPEATPSPEAPSTAEPKVSVAVVLPNSQAQEDGEAVDPEDEATQDDATEESADVAADEALAIPKTTPRQQTSRPTSKPIKASSSPKTSKAVSKPSGNEPPAQKPSSTQPRATKPGSKKPDSKKPGGWVPPPVDNPGF